MTFKLPEPDHSALAFVAHRGNKSPIEAYYTEAQLLQVRRDALEEAALICYRNAQSTSGDEIRKLKDETK
jgi:hypothetical protein